MCSTAELTALDPGNAGSWFLGLAPPRCQAGQGQPWSDCRLLLSPDALAETMAAAGRSWLAVGDGAVEFRTALKRSGARIPGRDSGRNRVSAVQHCRLATGLAPVDPDGVQPEYLRLPDAELTLRAARQP